ncbi:MAG: rRNA maturation RNase YbeY [Candidatus Berkelbacteria bacterium]|nr:MAG: rRNA maturation RNase YbeY [Candidatus Berkelbacteria bacterium]QQG51411.1 MAG: rRNA maturation RNase YbeY [Candidatus Berkelbacteria bacterium]
MGQAAEFTFTNETGATINEAEIRNHLQLILRRLDYPVKFKAEVVFVGDEKITTLNAKFREQNNATDVLSFADPEGSESLGSIVISLETADRQAKEAAVPLETEVKTLAGHGLLHLLGYDHK